MKRNFILVETLDSDGSMMKIDGGAIKVRGAMTLMKGDIHNMLYVLDVYTIDGIAIVVASKGMSSTQL